MGDNINWYYGRTLMSPETLEEISQKHTRMLNDPFHDEPLATKELRAIFEEANVNSARLESQLMFNELLRRSEEKPPRKVKLEDMEEATKKIRMQLQNAWSWASQHYTGAIDEFLVTKLGTIIAPDVNKEARLRTSGAKVGTKIAMYPEKLRLYFDEFLEQVNGRYVKYEDGLEKMIAPITVPERAAFAHLMTFYLQPNNDGNKRTGRILQNLILVDSKLPPPIIYGPESDEYVSKLLAAWEGIK
ncbi:Fic family protein, partial [Candidatus Woesearchaeota archaeon]|nr:Fic family protein [Candidatus Woesearchaeota archaeon]